MVGFSSGIALAVSALAAAQSTTPPYSMRGLQLGITKEEFKSFAIPNDTGALNPQAWCSDEVAPKDIRVSSSAEERADGVTVCQWFSTPSYMKSLGPDDHWIDLGTGKGPPVFRFVKDGQASRLFEISFYANTQYYSGIYDALARNYGPPAEQVEPFQTKAGSTFESKTSVWNNGVSSITLTFRCRHLERYCLTYRHTDLEKVYQTNASARQAAAASKI